MQCSPYATKLFTYCFRLTLLCVCVQAAVNGFEITFFAPSRTFDAHHEDHGKALMKVLMDLSNVHQRFKSVTHLVEYPESQDAVPTVEYSMKVRHILPAFQACVLWANTVAS